MVHNITMSSKTPSPTVRDLLMSAAKRLQPRCITCAADHDLGRFESEVLLAHVLKKDRTWLHAHDTDPVTTPKVTRFTSLVTRRVKREPIAYILGEKDFYGHPFIVDRRVLIPRPESEMLVELVAQKLFPEPNSNDLVWDVGTGSGAIAISVAKKITPRKVLATDISTKALTVAKKNAQRLKTKNIQFLKANLLAPTIIRLFERIRDGRLVIVANLPYLPDADKKRLDLDVVKYEPGSALFSGRDGLKLIEKFLRQLASFDIHFSSAFFEYDPPQTKKLRALAKSLFPKAKLKVHKDLAKRDRVFEITPTHESL